MKVQERLDEIKALVGGARTLPMSSSIVVNKAELLRLLTELGELLPDDLAQAEAVLSRRDAMLYETTANAERLLTAAMEERQRMISEEEVLREARIEAAEVIRAAQERSERTSREIDEYVDAKLAHLEVSVTNILETVRHGRQRLAEPGLYNELAAQAGADAAAEVPLPRRPMMPVTEGLLSPSATARGSAPAWDGPLQWEPPTSERNALPRRGLSLGGEATPGGPALLGRDAPPEADALPEGHSLPEVAGRHADRAEPAGSAETREITAAAEGSAGWTPRRPENPAASDTDASEGTEQSAAAAPAAAAGEPTADEAANPTAEQGEPTSDSRAQEARTE